MAKKYRVGVIGSTNRGNYGHGLDTVWREFPNTEVVAVADDHKDGLAKAVKRLGNPRGYADYRKMLNAFKRAEESGLTGDEAELFAFQEAMAEAS